MKENLRTTHYSDGWPIEQNPAKSTTEAYYVYSGNSTSNFEMYGLLYNWKAVMRDASSSNTTPSGVQGVCPIGWHVPSKSEWESLFYYVGTNFSQYATEDCQSVIRALCDSIGWMQSDNFSVPGYSTGNNATGFSIRPAGTSYSGQGWNNFPGVTDVAYIWSTTRSSNEWNVAHVEIRYNFSNIYMNDYDRGPDFHFSVRCLRD